MRRTLLLALLLATGCALPGTPETTAEALFDRGMEELVAGRPAAALTELQRQFPQSDWARRATQLSRLAAARDAPAQRLQAAEKALVGCRRDLEELKRLVIEMELRAK